MTGKIVHRSDVRQYSGGRFFTVHLMDDAGTVVGAKRWARGEEQEHANQIHALVPEGTVVTLTQCSVKPANRRYSNLASPVELTFQQTVAVSEEKSVDFEDVAPTVEYTSIADVQKDWSVNVCAVIHLDSGTQRVGAARKRKRDLVVTDASGRTIDVTIWEETIDDLFASRNPVDPGSHVFIAEGAHVASFKNGICLKVYRSTRAQVLSAKRAKPSTPAFEVLRWYLHERDGRTPLASRTRTPFVADYDQPRKTIDMLRDDVRKTNAGAAGQVHVALVSINDLHFWYPSAPDTKRRLELDERTGSWQDRDGKTYGAPTYRFLVKALLYDTNGSGASLEATLFDETVRQLVGVSAQELFETYGTRRVREVAVRLRDALAGEWIASLRGKVKCIDLDRTVTSWSAELAPLDLDREREHVHSGTSHGGGGASHAAAASRPRVVRPTGARACGDQDEEAGARPQKRRRKLSLQTVLSRTSS